MVIGRSILGPMNMALAAESGFATGVTPVVDPNAEVIYDGAVPEGDHDSYTAALFAQQALQQAPKPLITTGLPSYRIDKFSPQQNEGRSVLIKSEAWQIQKYLGGGLDGNVYSVKSHITGKMAALKVFNPGEWNERGEFRHNDYRPSRPLLSLEEGIRIFSQHPWAINREMVAYDGAVAVLMELVNGWTISPAPANEGEEVPANRKIGDATIPSPIFFGPMAKIQIARIALRIFEQTSRAGLRMFDVKPDTLVITNEHRLKALDLDRADMFDTNVLSSGVTSPAREYTFHRLRYAMFHPLSLLTYMVEGQEDFISTARVLGNHLADSNYSFPSIEDWFQKWEEYLDELERSIS